MTPRLGSVGVWSIGLRTHPDSGAREDAAAELEALGYGALWMPGGVESDVISVAGQLLDATSVVTIATGIVNIGVNEPGDVAAAFAGVHAKHPGRFLLGLGAGHTEQAVAKSAARPVSAMEDFLDALAASPDAPPAECMALAALGPRMLELAGRRSAGAHPYFVPVAHTRRARAVLGEGPLLAPAQFVVLAADRAHARELADHRIAHLLGMANYARNLVALGFSPDELAGAGSDRLFDALVAWGDEEAAGVRVAEHHEAGADHVCVQVIDAGADLLPRSAWRRLADALCVATR